VASSPFAASDADERERRPHAVGEHDARAACRRDDAGQPEATADFEHAPRPLRHALRQDAGAAPAVCPVWRLGRVVRAQQRVAIDVSLEIDDAHEPHAPGTDVDRRDARVESGDRTSRRRRHSALASVVTHQAW
jgi:hypothetical protein